MNKGRRLGITALLLPLNTFLLKTSEDRCAALVTNSGGLLYNPKSVSQSLKLTKLFFLVLDKVEKDLNAGQVPYCCMRPNQGDSPRGGPMMGPTGPMR